MTMLSKLHVLCEQWNTKKLYSERKCSPWLKTNAPSAPLSQVSRVVSEPRIMVRALLGESANQYMAYVDLSRFKAMGRLKDLSYRV
jgi:hypothetical protein